MGLPASQRRILEKIEVALRGSDPRLASLFAIFGRLTGDEEMPRVEQLRARAATLAIWLRRPLVAFARWLCAPRRARLRSAIFFPAALALVACTVLVSSGFSTAHRCAARAHATAQSASRTMRCPPLLAKPVYLAR